MSWNHRVIHSVINGEDIYQIHEVFYDDEGKPVSCTVEGVSPLGETKRELIEDMGRFSRALGQEWLEMSMFEEME